MEALRRLIDENSKATGILINKKPVGENSHLGKADQNSYNHCPGQNCKCNCKCDY